MRDSAGTERFSRLNSTEARALLLVGALGLLVCLVWAFGTSTAHAYPGSGSTAEECLSCHKGDPGTWGSAVDLYSGAHDGGIGECATCHTTEAESIHGRWNDTPAACASCHRTHSAVEDDLLVMDKDDVCVFCHGSSAGLAQTNVLDGLLRLDSSPLRGGGFQRVRMNTGTNVGNTSRGEWMFPVSGSSLASVTSRHTIGVEATVWGSWNAEGYSSEPNAGDTNSVLECVSCHDPHSYGLTYRMLTLRPAGSGIASHPGNVSDAWGNPVLVTDQLAYARWNPQSDILSYTTDDYSNTEIGNRTWVGGEWVVARQQGSSYAAPNVLDPNSGRALDVYNLLGMSPMYSQQISQWCASCHDRYSSLQTGHSGPGSSDTGDAIFGFRHKTGDEPPVWNDAEGRYESESCGYGCHLNRQVNCLSCHVAHGTAATMDLAGTGLPWPGEGVGQPGEFGNGTHIGEGWLVQDTRPEFTGGTDQDGGTRSSLLRIDDRGVCQTPACHPNGTEGDLDPFEAAGQQCDQCHQYSNPHDGIGSVECSACHEGVRGNDCTACHAATVTEWGSTGHGRASGGYTVSGNPAADFPGAAGGEDSCLYCHDDSVPHDTATNPFRLANTDGLQNDNCLVCHESVSIGYDPDGVGPMASKAAIVRLDGDHYGAKHGSGNNGGQFCWDCHDPHGDQNAAMVHDAVSRTSTVDYGRPIATVATTFTTMGTWGSYVNDSSFDGICQACHTSTVRFSGSTNYDSSHNAGLDCIACHTHDSGFATDAADCAACHASTLTEWSDTGHGRTSGSYAASVNPAADLPGAAGGESPCYYCHDPSVPHDTATNPFRLANTESLQNNNCLTCHDNLAPGYDPDGVGDMAPKSAITRVNSSHDGSKHGSGNNGGQFCWDCHDPHGDQNAAMVRDQVSRTSTADYGRPITVAGTTFTTIGTWGSYVNDSAFDGICQVCHTSTARFTSSTGYDTAHNAGASCTTCHTHDADFEHAAGANCADCHGITGSHAVHTQGDARGPAIPLDCSDCHDAGSLPAMSDGQDLAGTAVCDSCHSPDGYYNGVVSTSDSVGAKSNWDTGVYAGNALQSGKEKWCVGCHDQSASTIGGISAPPVGGDSSTWGYYATGHGVADRALCTDCHDLATAHMDGNSRTYSSGANNHAIGYRLRSDAAMTVPNPFSRGSQVLEPDYTMCWQSGCHVFGDVTQGSVTNFGDNLHDKHLRNTSGGDESWQSDWSIPLNGPTSDSRPTCPTCHNVHGPSNAVMVRDGQLTAGNGNLGWERIGSGGNCNITHCHGPEQYP